jgi:hypothetical protein
MPVHERRLRGGSDRVCALVVRNGVPTLLEFDTRLRFSCHGAIEISSSARRLVSRRTGGTFPRTGLCRCDRF